MNLVHILSDLKSKIIKLCKYFVVGVSYIFPRSNNIYAFGAREGEMFVDNTKYLYIYMSKEYSESTLVWISNDRDIVQHLNSEGYSAYNTNSFLGYYYAIRAGTTFVENGISDVNSWISRGSHVVNLWHGSPLKKVGEDIENTDSGDNLINKLKPKPSNKIISECKEVATIFESAFQFSPENIILSGYPRNDFLLGHIINGELGPNSRALSWVKNISSESSLIVYLPTFRDYKDGYINDHIDYEEMNEFLREQDAYLLIKPHPREKGEVDNRYDRIRSFGSKYDVYPILKRSDLLITDYSGVFFDYLLLDKPIIFYAFDKREYQNKRDFYYNYEEVVPGPIVDNFENLLLSISNELISDNYKNKRQISEERFLRSEDLHRCEYLMHELIESE